LCPKNQNVDRSVAPTKNEESSNKLKRELGLFDAVSVIVGIIVGSGIFVSPKGVLQEAGSPGMSLAVWTFSGLLSMIGALCYAELGTMIPKSGGDYAYIREAFGELPGFLYLWSALIMIMPAGNAIISLTFASNVLQPFFPECEPPMNAVRLLAASIICLLTAINCHNVKSSTLVQDIFAAAKVLALIIIILTGFVWLGMGHTENLQDTMANTKWNVGHLAVAFYTGVFSYAGWNYLNFVTEELKEPEKNLPRAIVISLPLVTIIYLLANFAYFTVLTPAEILASDAVAVTFGYRLFGPMAWLMPLFVACSTFGSVNGGIFASSRLFFVGARDGQMPRTMAFITKSTSTPMPSLVFLGLLTLLMLITDDVYELINYTAFVESYFTAISVAGLLYLRYRDPKRSRPIKVNIILPILYLLICAFLIVLPLWTTPKLVGVALLIIHAGIPVYFACIYWKGKPRWIRKLTHSLDVAVQRVFLALPEES